MTDPPATLHDALARARAQWPRLQLDDEVFVPYLMARAPAQDPAALASMHVGDLFVACGCVLGDPAALAAFDAAHGAAIRSQIAKIEPDAADDLAQRTLARLLVGDDGELPRIATFAGRSPLAAWLKVVATREALMHRRKAVQDAAPLSDIVDAEDDPELALMRTRYRDDFRRAFEDALSELPTDDRTMLRYQLVDRLTIDQLAKLHGVHRATAARRLAKARDELLRNARRHLLVRLQLSREELESVFRLVQSQLEVSVRRLLDA